MVKYLKARIGVAKRVHYVSKRNYDMGARWGVGLCQKWAGLVRLAESEEVTCIPCKHAFIKKSSVMRYETWNDESE